MSVNENYETSYWVVLRNPCNNQLQTTGYINSVYCPAAEAYLLQL